MLFYFAILSIGDVSLLVCPKSTVSKLPFGFSLVFVTANCIFSSSGSVLFFHLDIVSLFADHLVLLEGDLAGVSVERVVDDLYVCACGCQL